MTRKDFELIAKVLRAARNGDIDRRAEWVTDAIAEDMADGLATTNPRFNREKFLRACGVEQ